MLRVVVYDGGWGGEVVARFLTEELGMVEVVRVIDWNHAPYENKTVKEVCQLARQNLARYIGRVDLIVLGGYAVTAALEELRGAFPTQTFVGVNADCRRLLKSRMFPRRVALLMSEVTRDSGVCQAVQCELPSAEMVVPECVGWEALANGHHLVPAILRRELGGDFALVKRPGKTARRQSLLEQIRAEKAAGGVVRESRGIQVDMVILLETYLWEVKTEIEELFGWRVRVIDFREQLLRDVCVALKLLGVDGRQSRRGGFM